MRTFSRRKHTWQNIAKAAKGHACGSIGLELLEAGLQHVLDLVGDRERHNLLLASADEEEGESSIGFGPEAKRRYGVDWHGEHLREVR
jgi:hypothetical protein